MADHEDYHELEAAIAALGVILKSDFDATSFLYATLDDTPLPKTPTEIMAILSGQAGAAFRFNNQNLSGIGTISCGDITTSGDITLPASGIIQVADLNPRLQFDDINSAIILIGKLGIGVVPSFNLDIQSNANVVIQAQTNFNTTEGSLILGASNGTLKTFYRQEGSMVGGNFMGLARASASHIFTSAGPLIIGTYAGHDLTLGTNNLGRITVDSSGNVDIIAHNAATLGLKLAGTLILPSAAEINFLNGVSYGDDDSGGAGFKVLRVPN